MHWRFSSPNFYEGPLPEAPEADSYAEVCGARIRYRVTGSGPAVVLLHGYASSLDAWDEVVPALAERHQVIAVDLKGFGYSSRGAGDYSPAAQARIVVALLDRLGLSRAALVGHSWGASVALATCLAVPKRITRLALYDAWVFEDQLPAWMVLARADGIGEWMFGWSGHGHVERTMPIAYYDRRRITADRVRRVEKLLELPGSKAAALATLRAQKFRRQEQRYGELTQPVLLLWGKEDCISTLPVAYRLLRQLRHAELKVYPRCGHFPMVEALDESNRDLARFLEHEVEAAEADALGSELKRRRAP
ncbi:MAG: alpha/beta fold hydrolase [Polyangiaceae bacterium]